MSDGPGSGDEPPASKPPPPGGKRPAIGLQLKLPCATLDEIKARYGEDLKAGRFFIRTKSARPKDTLVRLEAQLSDGTLCFRAAGVVVRVVEAPSPGAAPQPGLEPGIGLQLLAVDDAGRDLIVSLGGKPPPALKLDARPGAGRSDPKLSPVPASVRTEAPKVATHAADPAKAAPRVSDPKLTPVAPAQKPRLSDPKLKPVPPSLPRVSDPKLAPVPPAPHAQAGQPQEPPGPPPVMTPAAGGPPSAATQALTPTLAAPGTAAPTSKKGPVIGIDLGTTNSCAAVVQKGKPFVIPSREGYNTIPSIVALNEKGKLIIGHPAKGQMLTNPRNTVYGAKRLVGRAFSSQVVTDLTGRFQYQIVAGPRGEAAVQLGDQVFSLQQISALVLGEVKEIAQQYLQSEVSRAVITVPAYYNDNQRQAVREAGALAGLSVERILNEPTAAALAFAHGRSLQQRVLIYDLGGGTFDASVLQLQGNVYEVVSTGGDTFLGGVDFDKVLVDHLLQTFKEKNGIDFPGDRVALQRVTDAAERAKIALSEQLEYKVRVPFVAMIGDKPYDLEATLSRSELVLLTGHLIDRTLKVCTEVLEARGLKPKDIDEVLLVGGQSRMPLVRERIRNFFGREPSKAVHPDEAVALGAALLAEQMGSGDIGGVVLVDVLPMSIGIGLPGGRFKKVIERNTSLPHKRGYSISTTKDDQSSMELAIFQGESDKAQDNEYLGTITVSDLPLGTRGTVSFDIQFALSPECLLTVSAQEKGTGRVVTATFTTQDTPEAVRKKLQEEEEESTASSTALAKVKPKSGGFFGWLKRLFGGR